MDIPAASRMPSQEVISLKSGGISASEALELHVSDDGQERISSAVARLSYNTGHGDFCFGRLVDRHQYANWSDKSLTDGSSGAPIPELNGFQRSGPFKFFKLPIEIRHRIYRLFLGPFFTYDCASKVSFIELFYREKQNLFWGDWGFSQLAKDSHRTFDTDTEETDTEETDTEDGDANEAEENIEKRQMRQERHEHQDAEHPERSSCYELIAYPRRTSEHQGYDQTDYLLLEWIRLASNISPLFRKELGDVFWTNVHFTYSQNPQSMRQLLPILQERPAIHNSIKFLSMDLNFDDDEPWEDGGDFEALCDYLSRTLKLDNIFVAFRIKEEEISQFSLCEGRFASLLWFKKIHVNKGFDLFCDIDTDGVTHSFNDPEYDDDDDAARDEYTDGLQAQWEPILRQSILPDTLRVIEESEQEKYLKSRRPLRSSKDIPEE